MAELEAKPGSVWTLAAQAVDLAGSQGSSRAPTVVRVISEARFAQLVEIQLVRLHAALEQALSDQRIAHERVKVWRRDEVSDQWPSVEQAFALLAWQRQVARPLSVGADAALSLVGAMLSDHRRNNVAADGSVSQLERVRAVLTALTDDELPALEDGLSQFTRELEHGQNTPANLRRLSLLLADLDNQQRAACSSLQGLLDEIVPWNQMQQYRRDILELKQDQAALVERTRALARDALEDRPPSAGGRARNRQRARVLNQQRDLAARLNDVRNARGAVTPPRLTRHRKT